MNNIEAFYITLDSFRHTADIRVDLSISDPFKCHNCEGFIDQGKGYFILDPKRHKVFHLCRNCGNEVLKKLEVIECL